MSCLVAIGIVGPKRNISLGPDWSRLEQAGLGQVAWSDSALRSQPGGLEEVRDPGQPGCSADQLGFTQWNSIREGNTALLRKLRFRLEAEMK